jgi:hypothetical protein
MPENKVFASVRLEEANSRAVACLRLRSNTRLRDNAASQ